MLYPLKLEAPLKDYIWGGTKLKTQFGKITPLGKVAESWALSGHKDGQNIIENGHYKGMKLPEYIEIAGRKVLGKNAERFADFPILVKLIDAADDLSVQVHPDDAYALAVEGEYGKMEMWYVVDCEEGATLLHGFKKEITKEECRRRIESNTLLEVCNKVLVKKGDVFFIEAGMVHAIGKGIVIAEIQQNSNTTYRMYDYGRLDAAGNQRQLHVEKALDVAKLTLPGPPITVSSIRFFAEYEMRILAECEYFSVYYFQLKKGCNFIADECSFQSILVLEGELTLRYGGESMALYKGDSVFVPAGMGEYNLCGTGEMILSMV